MKARGVWEGRRRVGCYDGECGRYRVAMEGAKCAWRRKDAGVRPVMRCLELVRRSCSFVNASGAVVPSAID